MVEWCPPMVPTVLRKATVVVGRSAGSAEGEGERGLHRAWSTMVMLL